MIDVAFLGADVRPAGTAVVIDVLRATSTITLAFVPALRRRLASASDGRPFLVDASATGAVLGL